MYVRQIFFLIVISLFLAVRASESLNWLSGPICISKELNERIVCAYTVNIAYFGENPTGG